MTRFFNTKEFLLLDEMVTEPCNKGGNPSSKIELHKVSVKWPVALSENEENTITNASFNIGPGQLLTVLGSVGSGKVIFYLIF